MIRLDLLTYRIVWTTIGVLLAAGWVVYGVVGSDSSVFLVVMLVASLVLGGGGLMTLRRRAVSQQPES